MIDHGVFFRHGDKNAVLGDHQFFTVITPKRHESPTIDLRHILVCANVTGGITKRRHADRSPGNPRVACIDRQTAGQQGVGLGSGRHYQPAHQRRHRLPPGRCQSERTAIGGDIVPQRMSTVPKFLANRKVCRYQRRYCFAA